MNETDATLLDRSTHEHVLFVQRLLPHYRLPIFNKLGEVPNVKLTLGLFETPKISEPVNFHIKKLCSQKRAGFWLGSKLEQIASQYDTIIIPFDLHEISCLKLLLASRMAKKTILFGHSHGRNKKLRLIRRALIRRASATVVYTPYGKERLTNEGVDPRKLFVANNTVEVNNAEFQPQIEKKSFLFVGRLTARKQILDLINAFADANSSLPNWVTVEIVGDGEQRPLIESLVNRHRLENRVYFHGKVLCEEKLKKIFSRAIAYVSPGHVGLGVVHSFAYGTPVVTTGHSRHAPEFSYVSDQENGLLYDGKVTTLSKLLIQLTNDRSRSLGLGEKAFKYFTSELKLDKPIESFITAIDYSRNSR